MLKPTIVKIILQWQYYRASLIKNLPAMQETQIWSLGHEDPLEKARLKIKSEKTRLGYSGSLSESRSKAKDNLILTLHG